MYYTPEHIRCDTLLKALHKQAELDLKEDISSDITIIIGDTVVKFSLGGPQIDAVHAFINHLAAENLHNVDIENSTVTGVL